MSRIRAVCLSDLHFGAETSVLTALDPKGLELDYNRVSPVLESLVECLKAITSGNEGGKQPELVLAGDVLELALATTNVASTVFAQFARLLFENAKPPIDRRIVYVPGNHDHHLWETAREDQYASYISEPDTRMPLRNVPWHATHLFPWREDLNVPDRDVESAFLNTLLGFTDAPDDAHILAMYPNLGILSADRQSRCSIVHHGHFTESIYHLMTELRKIVFPSRDVPDEIWDVEAENYAWIDFLWGTLGRSGGVGKDMELVYDMLKSKKATRRLLRTLARSIPEHFGHPMWLRLIETPILCLAFFFLGFLVKRSGGFERHHPARPLSDGSWKRLAHYISRYVRGQLDRECKDGPPDYLTFIFGHTHKPFEEVCVIEGVDAPVHVYNTGGWVVDTPKIAPHQGAAIVVIDDERYVASIRMYNQSAEDASYRVNVARADAEGNEANPLYDGLRDLVDPDRPPWSDFSRNVREAVKERHRYMNKVIDRAGG